MKKILGILSILLCLSTIGYSQFTKGKILAGGSFNVNLNSNKYKNGGTTTNIGNSNSMNLNPQVGYFFMDNFAAGAGLSIGASSYKSGNVKYSFSNTYFSPFARYYFGNIYGQAAVLIGSSKAKNDAPNSPIVKSNSSGWSLLAGYAYLLNDHVAIEPQIGYGLNYDDENPGTSISGGLFIRVGLQVYLGK